MQTIMESAISEKLSMYYLQFFSTSVALRNLKNVYGNVNT